jgi:two-component system nitrate/nitrite response regulator NarL
MRVLVADDHSLFRDGLVSLLEVAGYTVVGQAGDGQSAVDQAFNLQPDLILLDLHMPIMNGLDALRHIKEKQPGTFVVMLTVSDDESHLVEAMKAGANGYLYKHLNSQEFLRALEGLQRGEAAISMKSATVVIEKLSSLSTNSQTKSADALSEREVEILRLVANGYSNAVIATKISISENTVKYHLKHILQKLNARNRTEAVTAAMQAGILKSNDLPV